MSGLRFYYNRYVLLPLCLTARFFAISRRLCPYSIPPYFHLVCGRTRDGRIHPRSVREAPSSGSHEAPRHPHERFGAPHVFPVLGPCTSDFGVQAVERTGGVYVSVISPFALMHTTITDFQGRMWSFLLLRRLPSRAGFCELRSMYSRITTPSTCPS